jgi:hypothetical protein
VLNIPALFQIKKKVCKIMHLNTLQHVPFPVLTEVIGPLKEQRVTILTSIIPTLASLKATGPRFSIGGQYLSKSTIFRKLLDKISERGFSTSILLHLFTLNFI